MNLQQNNYQIKIFSALLRFAILARLLGYNVFMNNLPSNIQHFLQKYQQKMTGKNPETFEAARSSLASLEKAREEDGQLRKMMEIVAYENEKGVENELLYVVRLRGRRNSYYQGRILIFYMLIFDNFPNEPPQLIAGHILNQTTKKEHQFLHINISKYGQMCMNANRSNQEYYDTTTIKDIILELEQTIYFPNLISAYDNQLYRVYKNGGDNREYYHLLNCQAKSMEEEEEEEEEGYDSV